MKLLCLLLVPLLVVFMAARMDANKKKSFAITDISDVKEYKQLLKSRTNVLILHVNNPKQAKSITDVFHNAADQIKRHATVVIIDCSTKQGAKLCKRNKIPNDIPYVIKHYSDGNFHKDYDRAETVKSVVSFLRDPTGGLPWEEDPTAMDVIHLEDTKALSQLLETSMMPVLIMFYATWCGHCQRLKPDYSLVATELKGRAKLAAMDVFKPSNLAARQLFNITSFPTILYFENGKFIFPYNGDYNKLSILEFMKNPQHIKKVDESWAVESNDVQHLTDDTFDSALKQSEHALIAFYAPWCGHCKRLKPEFERAAGTLKRLGYKSLIGAVDVTKDPDLGNRFDIKGYPTLKYFYKGEFKFDAGHIRHEVDIVNFMKDPKGPGPSPPPESLWPIDTVSIVRNLSTNTFKKILKKIKHAIVMFYAPWCTYCKQTKPEFENAADQFAGDLHVGFFAVDCEVYPELCHKYEITGYPTLRYFSFFNEVEGNYTGRRKTEDFVSFIHTKMGLLRDSTRVSVTNEEAGFGVNVVMVTDSEFETIVQDKNPTFIMFYAEWCSYCTTVKPIYSELATDIKLRKYPVNIVAIDASENPKSADIATINSLPTFKLYSGGKEIAKYEGNRSKDEMLQFIQNQLNIKDEL